MVPRLMLWFVKLKARGGGESCGCKRDGGTEIGDELDEGKGDGGGGEQIEKIAKKLRKESKAAKQTLEALTSAEQLEILSGLSTLFAESNPISESTAEEKTLREHAAPQVNQAPLCIATPTLQAPLELKTGLIHLLPKFRRLMNEDPYQHLKVFHVVFSSMKPERVTEEQIKLRAFPFSLDGAAKE
ncbi:uncharacterized protein G2W53_041929 [Senna tora]|uniref:Uncharacterized protein n=1 Tax=Senna tora TaxID=362788 RepID=A0A834VYH6_9FABA|nr:uncharacterized protein G2W53_041929 [Senna tora]